MEFVLFMLGCVVGVVVCQKDHEHDQSMKEDDDMFHSTVDKDNNMFRSNVDLEQFLKKGNEDYGRHGVPPFDDDDDDDHMNAFSMDDEEMTKRGADGRSFSLNDEWLAKRGANGKPVSFKMKGDGTGFKEDFGEDEDDADSKSLPSDDDFEMPEDMGEHDFSSFPFTDHGSPFKDAGFPFDDDHSFGMDDDESMAWDNDDGDSHKMNDGNFDGTDGFSKAKDNTLHEDAFDELRREKEHEEFLEEEKLLRDDVDHNLGIRKKREEKGGTDKEKNTHQYNDGDDEETRKRENELLKERTMTSEIRDGQEIHCWDVVVSMSCKRVELLDHPFSKRVCDNKKIEKKCTKVESK